MNVPKAIELAMATLLREFGHLPAGVGIRVWQTMAADATWNAAKDREFPLIDVRCSPPKTDDNQATLAVDCSVLAGTLAADDKDHALISVIYEEIQNVLDLLFSQFRAQSGDALARFNAIMAVHVEDGRFQFGGFTFGDALSPFERDGANMIGTTLTVHYGRSDF